MVIHQSSHLRDGTDYKRQEKKEDEDLLVMKSAKMLQYKD